MQYDAFEAFGRRMAHLKRIQDTRVSWCKACEALSGLNPRDNRYAKPPSAGMYTGIAAKARQYKVEKITNTLKDHATPMKLSQYVQGLTVESVGLRSRLVRQWLRDSETDDHLIRVGSTAATGPPCRSTRWDDDKHL